MTAYYNEFDPKAAAWLRELIKQGHIAPGDVDERSISDVKPDDLRGYTQCHFFAGIGVWSYALRNAGWPDDRPVWTGSCPCQPFSAAGKGKGIADERHLWPHWYWLISQCRPVEVFGEQVASKDGRAWFDTVQADMEALGFAVAAADLCTAGCGAPHIRQRLWFYGAVGDTLNERLQGYGRDVSHGGKPGRDNTKPCRSIAAPSATDGMADDERQQRIGRRSGEAVHEPGSEQRTERLRDVDGLGDARGKPCERDTRGFSGAETESSGERCTDGRHGDRHPNAGETNTTNPTNGFWRDVDWLGCRDGKFRPVEPMHVKMVDGPTRSMVSLCTKEGDSEVTNETMQKLRETFGAEEVPERSFRGQRAVRITSVLRQGVHGGGLRGNNQGDERQKQSSSVGENTRGALPGLREEVASRPPCERNTHGQFPAELDDIVRLLSPSLSLAKLYNRRETAVELQALLETIREEGDVFDPSIPTKEIWASLGKEAKGRVRMGFDASRWVRVETSALANKIDGRVTMLRGYGNAIVAPVAQTFIEATQGW